MGAVCCKEEEIDFSQEVELNHFYLLRSVGKGAFGKVRVVQHKQTKTVYALKYINKAKCIKMRAVENIISERRLLEQINFPLIVNLRYAFQDDENLFMVLDLMLGGDLRFHLERQGQMSEEVVKFYVAEVSLGLHYLHSKKIVHRDLKPDNVLLDEKGHAHLTDFNIAVHYSDKKALTAVAGSMAYMAPEVLMKRGYFSSVDWWSLGVVMYELLFGKRPFRGKTNDALTQAILHDPLTFPEGTNEKITPECLEVLRGFCNRDISKRLGCSPAGLEDIKRHPWFKGLDWEHLETKEAIAPFIPDSKRANFDATHELEELLLEDNPLKAKKRQKKPVSNAAQSTAGGKSLNSVPELSRELMQMEERFLVYDYTKPPPNRSSKRNDGIPASGSTTQVEKVGDSSRTRTVEEWKRLAANAQKGTDGAGQNARGFEYQPQEWKSNKEDTKQQGMLVAPNLIQQRDSLIINSGGNPPPPLPPPSIVPVASIPKTYHNGTAQYRPPGAEMDDDPMFNDQGPNFSEHIQRDFAKHNGPPMHYEVGDYPYEESDLEMVGIKKRSDHNMRTGFANRFSDESGHSAEPLHQGNTSPTSLHRSPSPPQPGGKRTPTPPSDPPQLYQPGGLSPSPGQRTAKQNAPGNRGNAPNMPRPPMPVVNHGM